MSHRKKNLRPGEPRWCGKKQEELRLKLGYSQGELGRHCGTSQQYIATVEAKGCQPRLGMAILIAGVLRKPLEYFIIK